MPTRKPAPSTVVQSKTRPHVPKKTPKKAVLIKEAPAVKEDLHHRNKLVRDGFTMPKDEYAALGHLKERAARLMRPTKKGEVLRAGILVLSQLSDKGFLTALNAIPSLKTGRPKLNETASK